MPSPSSDTDFNTLRRRMVEQQLAARGISDEAVLEAMRRIPREIFVPAPYRDEAYKDGPLPIGDEQTISQPFMVALMTELLRLGPRDRVLEIGTGSGYQAAVLHAITPHVYTIERIAALARQARSTLDAAGCTDISIRTGDGTMGWIEEAPFDAIIVTSGAPEIPVSLQQQLCDGGRLVVPVGSRFFQTLYLVERKGGEFPVSKHSGCVFVPLIGSHGWPE